MLKQQRTLEVNVIHNNGVPDLSALRYEHVIVHGVTSVTDVTVTDSTGKTVTTDHSFEVSFQVGKGCKETPI